MHFSISSINLPINFNDGKVHDMTTQENSAITQLRNDVLARVSSPVKTIGQLEAALLATFPAQDAEDWDKTGLLAGNPGEEITRVAIALDATVEALRLCTELGCNVLLTHHPAFLNAPETIKPLEGGAIGSGGVVWEALTLGVALMNAHTALDVSPYAAQVLPHMLGLKFASVLEPTDERGNKGYGQLCSPDETLNLTQLSSRCISVFGRVPRVYGNPATALTRIVTATGSASSVVSTCIEKNIDCLVCGEIRYHSALDALASGLCIIELGHDVSELPLCAVLAQFVGFAGIPEEDICILDQGHNWWTPDAIRQ